MPFTVSSFIRSSTSSISGPLSVIPTGISSNPKCSVIAKWRSYPGAGHKNLRFFISCHGFAPHIPSVMPWLTSSYIIVRLLFPPTMVFTECVPIIWLKSLFASSMPSSPP